MKQDIFDLCVIGGGVNGAGIARDAAGRGLSVLLVERGDLGGATSSASTKLIHGGLRYLEYGEFRLVREALKEREVLWRAAPHIVSPLTFVLPHDASVRPLWMIRAGLFLYDRLGGRRRLPASRVLDLRADPRGEPLQDGVAGGFSYSDCRVDDARLVVLNAVDAARRGAKILTRTACSSIRAQAAEGVWQITLKDEAGSERTVTARAAVNATGPWVRSFLDDHGLAAADTPRVRLVRGSHIVVPALYEGDHAYILQQPDRRVVFAIPYERVYTLIGTTEKDATNAEAPEISGSEIDYLCAAANRSFKRQSAPSDIVWTYSGVRPLLDSGQDSATAVTRDYLLHMDMSAGPPLLSVFGGKITTYRRLAEEAVSRLLEVQGKAAPRWTARAALPGGDIPAGDMESFIRNLAADYLWLPFDLLHRYARCYGTEAETLLEGRSSLEDMGAHFGGHLYEAEIEYLLRHEFVKTAEDILWRRTKLGLRVPEAAGALEKFIGEVQKFS